MITLNSRWTLDINSGASGTLTKYDDSGSECGRFIINYYRDRNHITIHNYYNVPQSVLQTAKKYFKKFNGM